MSPPSPDTGGGTSMIDADGVLKKVFSHRAYIPFVTCGDPDIETTEKLVRAMAAAGAESDREYGLDDFL